MDIHNGMDIIDSRDIEERLDELALDIERVESEVTENPDSAELAAELFDLKEEYSVLDALRSEAEGYCDWLHGATLVRYSYFKEHAMNEAESLGLVSETDRWPMTCLDWDKAADELKMDYTSVEFDGIEYWVQ